MDSFNEAEAIKPRKLSIRRQRRIARNARFNEAEAIKPRKQTRALEVTTSTKMRASMRPRQSSLGNRGRPLGHRRHLPCFNEAEAIKPRKHAAGIAAGSSTVTVLQ